MKYLKLFDEHSDYQDFSSGGTMELPNVSHCISENHVHYNPNKMEFELYTITEVGQGSSSHLDNAERYGYLDRVIEETPVTNPRVEVRSAAQPDSEPLIYQVETLEAYDNEQYFQGLREGSPLDIGSYTAVFKFDNNGKVIKTGVASFNKDLGPS